MSWERQLLVLVLACVVAVGVFALVLFLIFLVRFGPLSGLSFCFQFVSLSLFLSLCE